ncbi:MAG: hypothetical protein J0H42_18350 [Rhizobiales bacterium]|nr:hypothetical protein [Hyphomicrobiales bacterium]
MTNTEDTEDRAKKERSPSYPFISLPRAIERAQQFSDAHRRSPARVATVADTWRYAQSSSGLLQTLSAMKAYGLLEDTGKGQDRKVQLTELAQRILHDARPGAKEAAVKDAALSPRLFAEYANKWLPIRPSDSHCLSELRLDRGFTEAASKVFLRSFDETFSFVNLSGEDNVSHLPVKVSSESDDEEIAEILAAAERGELTVPEEAAPFAFPWQQRSPAAPPRFYGGEPVETPPGAGRSRAAIAQRFIAPRAAGSPRATLPLPEGIAALEIPARLSRKSFEALKSWVDVMVSLAEKSVSSKWYVEWYTPTSTKAEEHYLLSDWAEVQNFMTEFKKAVPGVIFRVIAPDDASQSDLAELRAVGVRTF